MGTLLLALGVGGVGATAVLLASCLRLPSVVGFLLASYLFASAEVVGASLLLSTGRWLTRDALLVVVGVGLGLALILWSARGRPRVPLAAASARAAASLLRDPILAVLAGLTALSQLYLLAVSLTVPQSVTDTMLYHLPRSALWKQQHAVAYVPNVPKVAVNVFPPNAEIETAATMILSGGDRFVGLVQLVALAFGCVAIAGVARRLGFGRRAAVFAALVFSTFTVVLLQTPTALNDLVVASFLIACAYFALGPGRLDLALGSLGLGLALGTKLTTVFALPALALVVFSRQPPRRWIAVALSGVAGMALGSVWLVVNVVETGRPDGNVSVAPESQPLAHRIGRSVADLLEMSDAEGKGLLLSPFWGVPLLVVAVVVAVVLGRRGRRRGAALAATVGVFAFVALPLLVTWARVAEHGLSHARAALGIGGAASGPRLPEGFYESPMHSSYGLAFLLLFFVSCVLVGADLARRRSSFAVAAALVGLPLTLLITAIVVGFDPQHMRYLVFPAALATSVFGIALRVRPIAWAATALAGITVAVSLAYFVPRPSGLALLSANRGVDRTARWFVQGEGGRGDPGAFRFLEESVPASATLALALADDTYIYPAWDAGLRRTVVFTTPDGRVPAAAGWVATGPGMSADLPRSTWARVFASPGGWSVYRRR